MEKSFRVRYILLSLKLAKDRMNNSFWESSPNQEHIYNWKEVSWKESSNSLIAMNPEMRFTDLKQRAKIGIMPETAINVTFIHQTI